MEAERGSLTATAWYAAVLDAERRAEPLIAFDLAERGLAQHPGDVHLEHRAVLALARAGSTEEAARRFREYELADVDDEDVAALGARLAKDVALAATGDRRRQAAAAAADRYAEVHRRAGGYYPAVNAATMSMAAGEPERARSFARSALELVRRSGEDAYYAAATEGEAQLLLGDETAALAALERAAALHGGDYGAVATTRRQLRVVCEVTGIDPEILSALSGPDVVHYCGHRIAERRFPAAAADALARRIAREIARRPPGYAFGSLASGADILWAEALLARGVELHVVLPFDRAEFVESSIAPAGPGWVERFARCLNGAARVSYATDDAFLGDDVLYRYAAELAMGLALLRARHLDADVRQLAVWDGGPARGAAGTAIDVATWRWAGRPVTIISPSGDELDAGSAAAEAFPVREAGSGRVVRSMLFADVKGFSKLADEQLPRFVEHVLGAFAAVLDRHARHVCHRNTWGDGVYVVLTDPSAAAACALDLQDAIAALDLPAAGLPPLAVRLAGHVGPVFPVHDPVRRAASFFGSHVARTARIEPVTPAGSVYLTEPFAAALVLAGRDDLACDYVGHMPVAKDFGSLRMYRLRRAAPSPRS